MNKIKKILIILLIIILIIIITLLVILKLQKNKQKSVENILNTIPNEPANIEESKISIKIDNIEEYINLKECLNKYMQYSISLKNGEEDKEQSLLKKSSRSLSPHVKPAMTSGTSNFCIEHAALRKLISLTGLI